MMHLYWRDYIEKKIRERKKELFLRCICGFGKGLDIICKKRGVNFILININSFFTYV